MVGPWPEVNKLRSVATIDMSGNAGSTFMRVWAKLPSMSPRKAKSVAYQMAPLRRRMQTMPTWMHCWVPRQLKLRFWLRKKLIRYASRGGDCRIELGLLTLFSGFESWRASAILNSYLSCAPRSDTI
mmetsp:Transcript_62890/g.99824  ORF Transcript_62890/g.99824 Transcript_62890/m.99824 type:complete len:127 (+) Transcript_62890:583-963(+)